MNRPPEYFHPTLPAGIVQITEKSLPQIVKEFEEVVALSFCGTTSAPPEPLHQWFVEPSQEGSNPAAPLSEAPSKKRLLFFHSMGKVLLGENQPSLCFKAGQNPSVFSSIVDKATDIVKHSDPTLSSLRQYKHLSTAVIEYESPNGCFHPHIDHCQNSFVYLISLGCTANFMVKGPTMQTRLRFKFCSGDMLVFNASTEAAILHGVLSIGDSQSCPPELGDVFQKLRNHRYGVQT